MNLSKKWLADYVDIGVTDKEFADEMTLSGSKVEGFAAEGADLKNIVVGKVLSLERHPDSDHLWVCSMEVGAPEKLQIVTGAQNLKEGDIVPVALHKSVVAGGRSITRGKLRGVMSEGMLCSLSELGLTLHDFPYACDDGIFVLGDDCDRTPGADIRDAIGLNDIVTEFEITPNRPDCLSVMGLAREASVTFGVPLRSPDLTVRAAAGGSAADMLKVAIHDPEKCYRYVGAVVKNVRIAPSPRWMRERLRACGVRPINNIVDITNYVMLELGQPMHAFDYRYLTGGEVNVRTAARGETITTLDGTVHKLDTDMLVIADAEKPAAVAGVMGGEYSGIMDDTTTIVFESACFNGSSVRTTAKRLGLRTESSARFEKELDPRGCMLSLMRALNLVELLDAGDVAAGTVDCDVSHRAPVTVEFNPEWVNNFIGISVPADEQARILEALGFKVENGEITVPSFRGDVSHPADISEEIARFYGFGKIGNSPLVGATEGHLTESQAFERRVRDTLLACGLSEIYTYSFVSPGDCDKISLPADSKLREQVVITNPLGEDTSVMRTTPLPSMLGVLADNYNNRNLSAKLFECATVYFPQGEDTLPVEKRKLCVGMYGDGCDFYEVKGAVEELLDMAGVVDREIQTFPAPALHPGRAARILSAGKRIAVFGEISSEVLSNYGFECRVYAAVIDFDNLYEARAVSRTYRPLPKYPSTERDLAFVCAKEITVGTLEAAISKAVGGLLESIALFDVYEGAQIPAGRKSVAFNLRLRSPEKTLTDAEADEAVQRAVKALEGMGISLRA